MRVLVVSNRPNISPRHALQLDFLAQRRIALEKNHFGPSLQQSAPASYLLSIGQPHLRGITMNKFRLVLLFSLVASFLSGCQSVPANRPAVTYIPPPTSLVITVEGQEMSEDEYKARRD